MSIEVPGATAEEVAAIVAALAVHQRSSVPTESRYERWRRARIKALVSSRR